MLLAFFGGGTRAAALSYGVLRSGCQANHHIPRRPVTAERSGRNLFGVGGSFTSAYFGLYGERIFDNKTFADLRCLEAPLIILNSSELGSGLRFSFTPSSFDRVSGIQIDRASAETILLVRNSYDRLAELISTEDKPVNVEFVDINFHSVGDPKQRKQLNAIETNFGLEDAEVDLLIRTGRQVLKDSKDFKQFIKRNSASSLQASISNPLSVSLSSTGLTL